MEPGLDPGIANFNLPFAVIFSSNETVASVYFDMSNHVFVLDGSMASSADPLDQGAGPGDSVEIDSMCHVRLGLYSSEPDG